MTTVIRRGWPKGPGPTAAGSYPAILTYMNNEATIILFINNIDIYYNL